LQNRLLQWARSRKSHLRQGGGHRSTLLSTGLPA
jgi:hypothetical protein